MWVSECQVRHPDEGHAVGLAQHSPKGLVSVCQRVVAPRIPIIHRTRRGCGWIDPAGRRDASYLSSAQHILRHLGLLPAAK